MQFRTAICFQCVALALSLTVSSLDANAGTVNVFTSDPAGFNTHSVWYDDGREITVVDAQFTPAHARALLADIRSKSKSPVTRVIVTHPNPDKFNGLSEGVEEIYCNRPNNIRACASHTHAAA